MSKLSQEQFLQGVQVQIFWDYKEFDESQGHSSWLISPSANDFYGDIYWKILTFIEAISDKSNVEQRKSIAKQLMISAYKNGIESVFEYMKEHKDNLQETRIIDWEEVEVNINKI